MVAHGQYSAHPDGAHPEGSAGGSGAHADNGPRAAPVGIQPAGVVLPRGWRIEDSPEGTAEPPDGFSWSWNLDQKAIDGPEPAMGPQARIPESRTPRHRAEQAVAPAAEEESWPMPYDEPVAGRPGSETVLPEVDTDVLHGGR